jgi:UDP-2,4-diacetamido-2,4,6-trideoxy-beta-L-altropyranose hydrolase
VDNLLLFRVDGNAEIGIGHVMRCLALAQAWQDSGGHAVFLMASGTPSLEERLKSEAVEFVTMVAHVGSAHDAAKTTNLARDIGASWVVVDGYHFGGDYQRFVKDAGYHLLFIDDYGHADHYCADMVLNQNLHAHGDLYRNRERYTRLLMGTRYVLLRREFGKWQRWTREIPEVGHKVLVTLGGSDPANVTPRIIEALQLVEVDELETMVVVGGSNPHYEALQTRVRRSKVPLRLQHDVKNMPELMAWSDVAVSAAGITSWELVFMGLPSLLFVQFDNQMPIGELFERTRVAVDLGRPRENDPVKIAQSLTWLLEDAERRREMWQRCQTLVDGEGASRVFRHMDDSLPNLRDVREEDCELIWKWANDCETRAASFSPDAVPLNEHVEWFRAKLHNPACVFYVATNAANIPVGQVRYDLTDDQAVVSVSVDRELRGKGYGTNLIWLSAERLFETTAITTIHAYIKPANESSIRAFEKVKYRKRGMVTIKGQDAVHLTLSRSGRDAR